MSDYISTSANRNPMNWCFLTFPQSQQVSKEAFLESMTPLGPFTFSCVARETHEDGSPHLHALVRFVNALSKSKVLKYFKETYPDDYKRIDVGRIKRQSTPYHAYVYLTKEDPEPLISGDPPVHSDPFRARLNRIARDLGHSDLEALQLYVEQRRERINKLDRDLLQCIANIEEHSLCPTWQEENIINLFSKNFTVEFSGILQNENHNVQCTKLINKYKDNPGLIC